MEDLKGFGRSRLGNGLALHFGRFAQTSIGDADAFQCLPEKALLNIVYYLLLWVLRGLFWSPNVGNSGIDLLVWDNGVDGAERFCALLS